MKLFHRGFVVIFSIVLLSMVGCFIYHSTKETAEPAAVTPSETTTTTTRSDDGTTTQQRSTTTTYP
jgi:hypothetical protein